MNGTIPDLRLPHRSVCGSEARSLLRISTPLPISPCWQLQRRLLSLVIRSLQEAENVPPAALDPLFLLVFPQLQPWRSPFRDGAWLVCAFASSALLGSKWQMHFAHHYWLIYHILFRNARILQKLSKIYHFVFIQAESIAFV